MPSFDIVNYSLRPSKSIQRKIVFDGLRALQSHLGLHQCFYIGFGSIWFTDFVMAHNILGIDDMISMEEDEIGYRRACFNSPYATVSIRRGSSLEILPKLCDERAVSGRPWVIWLDYDSRFNETSQEDTRTVIERAPDNTIFLITFNGSEGRYGKRPKDRPKRLRQLFGDVVPYDLSIDKCKGVSMQESLADLAIDFMKSIASDSVRPGNFLPAFRLIYKDSAFMVTVGGLLPSSETAQNASAIVGMADWKCLPKEPIIAPHLTLREAMTLQSRLPNSGGLSRDIVKSLGFDLKKEHIEVYAKYYREYPAFAQIVT